MPHLRDRFAHADVSSTTVILAPITRTVQEAELLSRFARLALTPGLSDRAPTLMSSPSWPSCSPVTSQGHIPFHLGHGV
ncbi:hypothetical protein [Dictyobacter formicarum]|uniref:hypothetical protein n=1 Tax=Dictyobacter formicarum TaxID=2778368 RepID=UPI001F1CDE7C|nr:hypothetical protein [Dictyobacter formicarum]